MGPKETTLPLAEKTHPAESLGEPSACLVARANVPSLIRSAGPEAEARFLEFFAARLRNRNTRQAYVRAAERFLGWCDACSIGLAEIEPLHVAAYVELLAQYRSAPTVKQHLAAVRHLFDWLVTGQVVRFNPASSVRGPTHTVRRGKTPVLTRDEARQLLGSIEPSSPIGLRDRALIGLLVYSFARISAAVGMRVADYHHAGRRSWIRLHEKGGRFHELPAHHKAQEYLDAYVEAAGLATEPHGPLFRSAAGRTGLLTERPLGRRDALRMVKRRARRCGLSPRTCCHSFRATGITAYLAAGGRLEHAQRIAGHESPRTTKLYDRTADEVSLDEIERIVL